MCFALLERMKKFPLFVFCLAALLTTGLTGCAGGHSSRTPELLSAAGFVPKTPKTDKQKEVYDDIASDQLLTGKVNGQRLYGYKDEDKGVVYVGDQSQYAAYKRLAQKDKTSDTGLTATEMNPETIKQYRTLVPYGYWR